MPRTFEAGLLHHGQREFFRRDFQPANAAQRLPQHVIIDDQRFKAEAQQRGVHPGGLVNHVDPGQSGHDVGNALFVSGLCIGKLGVGHARRRPGRQAQKLAHLAHGRRQDRLLPRTAGHGARAQVGDKRPRTENRRMPRCDRVDVNQPAKALGNGLHDRAGDGSGGGGPSLSGGQQQDRHPALDRDFHDLAGLGRKLHRRHHKGHRQ